MERHAWVCPPTSLLSFMDVSHGPTPQYTSCVCRLLWLLLLLQDISSRYAAVLFGITNALSSLMGTCSVYATGLILESTESWSLVFQLVAGFYLLGAVGFLAWASAEQQFE